jgi:hypothetical protein
VLLPNRKGQLSIKKRDLIADAKETIMSKHAAVFGINHAPLFAEQAGDSLIPECFINDEVALLPPVGKASKNRGHEKHRKAAEGTAIGATVGGAIGGSLGVLAGLGAVAISGVGPFIAAGACLTALAGIGVGSTIGGLVGVSVGMGISEFEAKRYEGRIKDGTQLSAHCGAFPMFHMRRQSVNKSVP